jgi:ATP-dependent helicase/nuclease subunit A
MNYLSDFHVREAALDTEQSFIVQAPAGSGKTTLLTKRFLNLLARVEQVPEECLGITFTRKAAAEMKDRILAALQKAKEQGPPSKDSEEYQTWRLAKKVLERDQAAGWELIHNPGRLKIQTVDALCAGITRQMPVISQFGAPPDIVNDPLPLYQTAARNLIQTLESTSEYSVALYTLLEHLDNNLELAERLLAEMLGVREQWMPFIGRGAEQDHWRHLLEQGLETAIEDTLFLAVQQIPSGFEALLNLAQFAAEQLQSNPLIQAGDKLTNESGIIHCQALAGKWPGRKLDDLPLWQGIAELLLTEKNTFRKTVTQKQGFIAAGQIKQKADKLYFQQMKQQMTDLLEQVEPYEAFRLSLQLIRECPPAVYSDIEWPIIEAMMTVLPVLVAHLIVVFQEKGQVDFSEVSLAASRALGDAECPTDLALGLDYKIKHILVDEFQDTSIPQLKLLEQLTVGWQPNDGRTLFLVGDPQQSIYRFRQAEVGLFLQAKHRGLGAIHLTSLSLSVNFRSDPEIVEWINTRFSEIFPKQEDVVSGAIAFSPSISALESVENVEVAIQNVTVDTEAQHIVDLIRSVKGADPEGSIALLVRSRNHLKHLIPYLKQQNIAYQGIDIERLDQHPLLQDLMTLTRALLHLGDRVSWLALLRTPWCEMSLHDLWIIANNEPRLPLWSTLKKIIQEDKEWLPLTQGGLDHVTRFIPILEEALAQRDRFIFSRWIKSVWIALSELNDIYIDEESLRVADRFFSILEEQKYSTDIDLAHFEKQMSILYAKQSTLDPKALQIMTIHKAKGLEFDTVVIAGLGRRQKAQSNKLLLWESRASYTKKPYLILAPIQSLAKKEEPIYTYLKNESRRREQFEEMRLLYVASTRAKKRLYWVTHENVVL